MNNDQVTPCLHLLNLHHGEPPLQHDHQHPAAGAHQPLHPCQEHHNIFAKLNPDEYKQVLGNMKHCILATDLALFFPNKVACLLLSTCLPGTPQHPDP